MNPSESNWPPQESETQSAGAAAPPSAPSPNWQNFPEDLRAPWGWADLFLFFLATLASYAILGVLLVAVFHLRGVSLQQLQNSMSLKSLFAVVNQLLLSAALLIYLYAHIRGRFGTPFWTTLGWRPFETLGIRRNLAYAVCIVGGFSFALLIQIASARFEQKTKMPIEAFFQDRRSALLLMAMGVLVAPLVEEAIFRGYIYPVLARSFGIAGGVVVTGALFGLLHVPQLWGGWIHIGLLVLVGIVFTCARAVSRTVVASYLLHLSYNSFLFAGFFISTSGFRRLPLGH